MSTYVWNYHPKIVPSNKDRAEALWNQLRFVGDAEEWIRRVTFAFDVLEAELKFEKIKQDIGKPV